MGVYARKRTPVHLRAETLRAEKIGACLDLHSWGQSGLSEFPPPRLILLNLN